SHSESNSKSSRPSTSSASVSVVADAPPAPTPMRIFMADSSRVRAWPWAPPRPGRVHQLGGPILPLRPAVARAAFLPLRCRRRVVDVIVHLVDATFELFRYFLSPGAAFDRSTPPPLRAVRGVVGSMLGMLEGGATHVGVATDHVVESFRNALWPAYK